MALRPDSAPPREGEPPDYIRTRPNDRAADWGWHGSWGGWARVAGWIVAAISFLMITGTQYNDDYVVATLIVAVLIRDWAMRRRDRVEHRWR